LLWSSGRLISVARISAFCLATGGYAAGIPHIHQFRDIFRKYNWEICRLHWTRNPLFWPSGEDHITVSHPRQSCPAQLSGVHAKPCSWRSVEMVACDGFGETNSISHPCSPHDQAFFTKIAAPSWSPLPGLVDI